MKTKKYQKSIHQHIEQILRHRVVIMAVMMIMLIAAISIDGRLRGLVRDAYSHGLGLIGVYAHHEHTAHRPMEVALTREVNVTGFK